MTSARFIARHARPVAQLVRRVQHDAVARGDPPEDLDLGRGAVADLHRAAGARAGPGDHEDRPPRPRRRRRARPPPAAKERAGGNLEHRAGRPGDDAASTR